MKVLGIETATAVCAAAVVLNGRVVAERSIEQKNVHAERLLSLIDEVLGSAGFGVDELDGVAASIGPGSFTGLRIGLSVAKGLVYATSRKLIAVPTLEALAMNVLNSRVKAKLILAALDARRDEVYCQLFEADVQRLTPVCAASDMTVSELIDELNGRSVVVAGDGSAKILSRAGSSVPVAFAGETQSRCSAASVALLGEATLAEGGVDDPVTMEPRYIKDFFLKSHT